MDAPNKTESYKKTTVVFPIDRSKVILGMKKRGFGEGWWNGFGGKIEGGETYKESAARETLEESGLHIKSLLHVANLHFYFNDTLGVVSRAYTSNNFEGPLVETSEMRPAAFDIDQLPYDTMWPADKLWIPDALATATPPLGFIIHFEKDKRLRSIEKVDPSLLEEKF